MRHSLLLVALAAASSGCCLCDNPFDEHYAAHGGRNPRVDMVCGRVNSAFRDAGGAAIEEPFGPGTFSEDGINDGYDLSAPSAQDQPFQLKQPVPYGEQRPDGQPYEVVPFKQLPSRRKSSEATEPELAEPELAEPELAEPELAEPELAEPELAEPEVEAELPDFEPSDRDVPLDPNLDESRPAMPSDQPTPAKPTEPTLAEPKPLEPETLTPPGSQKPTDEPSESDLDF